MACAEAKQGGRVTSPVLLTALHEGFQWNDFGLSNNCLTTTDQSIYI